MKLCVMGLGYIGLPTAVMFAKHGVHVHGVDVNPSVIEMLKRGQTHIAEPDLQGMMTEVMNGRRFTISLQPVKADVFVIAVPTPIHPNKTANLDYVKKAAEMILPYLEKQNLIILESTVPPKTINDFLIPILKQTSFTIGEDLFVSYSPERVYPGKLMEELVSNDRIVGGINERSSLLTAELYKRFVKGNIHITDATTAEMVKLIENAYRDINIAFSNELARIAENIGFNVWEAIRLANSHPRVRIHSPGPGVGGHCIAVDPWFIIEKTPDQAMLMKTARTINDMTPFHVAGMIEELVKDVSEPVITLLGLTYKENVDDLRESPSLIVMNELKAKGYRIKVYDPYLKAYIEGKAETLQEAVSGSDCLVVLTNHREFQHINFEQIKDLLRTKTVLDTRNALRKETLTGCGFNYVSIGTSFIRRDECGVFG